MHEFIKPTYEYFDWNRKVKGITSIQYVPKANSCASQANHNEEMKLYTWPGTVAGYSLSGKYLRGTMPTGTTGTALPAKAAVTVNDWRTGHFCIQRQNMDNFQYVEKVGTACQAGYTACSECQCVKGTDVKQCPVSQFELFYNRDPPAGSPFTKCSPAVAAVNTPSGCTTPGSNGCTTTTPAVADFSEVSVTTNTPAGCTTPGSNGCTANTPIVTTAGCIWGEKANENRSYLVYLTVEMFGTPCMNEQEHPQGTNTPWQGVINEVRNNCGTTFGADTSYSKAADSMTVSAFVADNNELSVTTMGTEMYNGYHGNTEKATLYSRYLIETKCNKECREFTMTQSATRLRVEMTEAYEDLDMICLVSGIGGMLALTAVLSVVFQKKRAKQSWYLLAMAVCLMVTFVVLIMVSLFIHTISYQYWAARNVLQTHASCITDNTWSKVPTELYNKTSMDSEVWWAKFFCVGLVLELISGLCVTYSTFTKLGRLSDGSHIRS